MEPLAVQLHPSSAPARLATRPVRPKSSIAPDICKRGDVVKNRWEVLEKLGAGTFGQVYRVHDMKTDQFWALKVESKTARKPVLRMDVAIAKAMLGKLHAAAFFACGHEEAFSYMVTQLLGKNLAAKKRASHDGRFPLRTVVRIGIQSLYALRELHQAGFVHRDVKPSNLAVGHGDKEKIIYLLDFGLARKFLDDKGRIYPSRAKVNFRGTIRYASPKAHSQQELSRVDDLWSLLYSLVDMHIGHVPWHNIRDMKRVGEAKLLTSCEELLKGFPDSWRQFFAVCKDLGYEHEADYEFLARSFNESKSRPGGIIDTKLLYTDKWEWDAPAALSHDASTTSGGSNRV